MNRDRVLYPLNTKYVLCVELSVQCLYGLLIYIPLLLGDPVPIHTNSMATHKQYESYLTLNV